MARTDTGGEVFNVGGRTPISMIELAHLVCNVTGSTGGITFVPYEAAYGRRFEDVQVRMPDTSKLESWLGAQTERSMADVIRECVDRHPSRRTSAPK